MRLPSSKQDWLTSDLQQTPPALLPRPCVPSLTLSQEQQAQFASRQSPGAMPSPSPSDLGSSFPGAASAPGSAAAAGAGHDWEPAVRQEGFALPSEAGAEGAAAAAAAGPAAMEVEPSEPGLDVAAPLGAAGPAAAAAAAAVLRKGKEPVGPLPAHHPAHWEGVEGECALCHAGSEAGPLGWLVSEQLAWVLTQGEGAAVQCTAVLCCAVHCSKPRLLPSQGLPLGRAADPPAPAALRSLALAPERRRTCRPRRCPCWPRRCWAPSRRGWTASPRCTCCAAATCCTRSACCGTGQQGCMAWWAVQAGAQDWAYCSLAWLVASGFVVSTPVCLLQSRCAEGRGAVARIPHCSASLRRRLAAGQDFDGRLLLDRSGDLERACWVGLCHACVLGGGDKAPDRGGHAAGMSMESVS